MIYLKEKSHLQPILAEEFRQYRKVYMLSQEQLAKRLGISVRSYIDLEHGLFLPSATTLIHFLLLLDDQELLNFLAIMEESLLN